MNAAHDTATQALTGSAAAGAKITVYDGATQLGSTTADAATGQWSFTLGSLHDGVHTLSATATNAGGVSAASASLTFTVDTVAPTPQLSDASYNTSTRLATLSGRSEAGSMVSIFDKGTLLGKATADSSGAWSFTTKLGSGVQSFTEQATDPAGNTGSSAGVALFDRSGSVKLAGGAGDDVIVGAGGDTLTGGGGHDTFVFNPKFGLETVTDFNPQSDVIALDHTLFSSFTSLMQHATQSGSSTLITYDGADVITLRNTSVSSLAAGDFVFV